MNIENYLQRARACLNMQWKDSSIGPNEILETLHSKDKITIGRNFYNDAMKADVYYYLMLYYKELQHCSEKKEQSQNFSVARNCIIAESNRQKGIEQ